MSLAEQVSETQARLALYIAAEQSILVGGQAYSIGNRSLDKGDLKEIRAAIVALHSELNTLTRGGKIRVQRVVPRDGI